MELVGRVGHQQALGLLHHGQALGAVGQGLLLLVQRLVGRQVEAGPIGRALGLVGAHREEGVAVGRRARPAHTPHLQLAGRGGFELLGPLGDLEADADADGVHVLLPLLDELAALGVGLGGVLKLQRRAVGAVAPAVAVAVHIAVQVQQGLGLGRVELAHLALEAAGPAIGGRRDRALALDGLAAAHQQDFLVQIDREVDGPAQRDLVRRVAADDGVFHVEVADRDIHARVALHVQAALGEVGCEMALGHGLAGEIGGHLLDDVEFAAQEGQPARLVLFDDVDLDAVDQRQLAALQRGHLGLQALIGVGRGDLGIALLAEVGVAREHDARAAPPFGQPEGIGADRVLHDLVAVELHHLARHGAEGGGIGEVVDEAWVAHAELELKGVAVQGLQAFDLAVVVEGLLGRHQGAAQLRQAEDLGVLEQVEVVALPLRVVVALERVDIVLRDQLALLAAEGRVVGKVDAGLDAEGQRLVVGADLGHGRQCGRAQLEGSGAECVLQRCVEDVRGRILGVLVRDLGRVETGFGNAEGITQHLVGGVGRWAGAGQQQGGQQGSELHDTGGRSRVVGKWRSLGPPTPG
mmetsp:Transcript_91071/g.253552  ORF Transcript_91071/g.253552 Transcript_91071/m.253552 type:complete len:580 (-) Transcript_91071:1454-3193(-)